MRTQIRDRYLIFYFGGKETNFLTSSICAMLANKTKAPVKLRLDRDDDIIITGKRHDFYSEYEVGFDELGVIAGLKLKLASIIYSKYIVLISFCIILNCLISG
mgnify:CR=1 FL=1